jgi:amino acid adenylation domain-containing protein
MSAAARSLAEDLRMAEARYPDRAAVLDGTQTVTYARLGRAAQEVASALAMAGARTGDCIAWHGEKNAQAAAAVHGILRAGAGYVPLDPDAPSARAAAIATGCRPRLLLADAERRRQWETVSPRLDWTPVPCPSGVADSLWLARFDGEPRESIPDLSYVLHTSGSTGAPKGVVHTHSSASAFVDWSVTALALSPDDVIVNSAPLHFDPTVLHLFAAVRAGAAVALMPASETTFPSTYLEFCRRVGGTIWYAVTSTLTWLVRHAGRLGDGLGGMRIAIVGGETLPPSDVAALFRAAPDIRLLNVYGPTESNVCTVHEMREPPAPDATIPIGRVLPGAEIVVVDDSLAAVSPGQTGQLLVRGSMLMRGYLDAEQTARAMVQTPDGGSWYASGDLVRENAAGDLEFLGRRDTQIKTRGFRVELGEIERQVSGIGGVYECAAVASPDPAFGLLITLFVNAAAETPAAVIARRLADSLPSYMLPRRIIELGDGLPRLSNGKVDRKTLEEIDRQEIDRQQRPDSAPLKKVEAL